MTWRIVVLIVLPIWAVLFGAATVALLWGGPLPETERALEGAAAGTFLVALPLSVLVARWLLARRERRSRSLDVGLR